jgi:molybdopterin synthase sulfur carrier subunit
MKLNLLFFGILTDATGVTTFFLDAPVFDTVATLDTFVQNKYPRLKNHSYKIAVNQKIIPLSHLLRDGDEVAFLPPFAGG